MWQKGSLAAALGFVLEDLPRLARSSPGYARLVLDFEKEYQRRKEEAGGVDFADLERLALAAKRWTIPAAGLCPSVAGVSSTCWSNEYQDINPVQDRLITWSVDVMPAWATAFW